MPIMRRAWFADHSPGNVVFVAAPPPDGAVDTFSDVSVLGPVPAGVAGSSKFTMSLWYDAASIGTPLGAPTTSGVDWFLQATNNVTHKDFSIANNNTVNSHSFAYHTAAGVGGSGSVLGHNTSPPTTGYVNILVSADLTIPAFTMATCYTALGPSGDFSSSNASFNLPGALVIPFDLVPAGAAGANWVLRMTTQINADGPILGWVRLFNNSCSAGATLGPLDPTSLGPVLLLHGRAPDFFTNRIDSSAWTPNGWSTVSPIPICT